MGFETFIGNPEAVATVRGMLASSRLPGALLFTGPDGVGKKTLALMLAKALNCERGPDDFCGVCVRCRKAEEMLAATREDLARRRESKDAAKRVEGLVYFDLQLIEPITRYILIEQIRQLRSVAYTHPFEFPRRVFVIDEAQAIHWQASDLLLKVLEEPPDTTTLILVCPNAYELRPTIRSRCRRVAFQPVDESTLSALLAEEGRVPKAQRALAARVAAGSIVKAKSFDLAEFERRRRPWFDFLTALSARASRPRPPRTGRRFSTPPRPSPRIATTSRKPSKPAMPCCGILSRSRWPARRPRWSTWMRCRGSEPGEQSWDWKASRGLRKAWTKLTGSRCAM